MIKLQLNSKKREIKNLPIWKKTKKSTFNYNKFLKNYYLQKRPQSQKKNFSKNEIFKKNEKKNINSALKLIEFRKKESENNYITSKETIFEKVEKTKEIYLIKRTTQMVDSEIDRINEEILNKKKK